MKKLKVVITAGGTGGHIYPALSILNKIKEEYDADILYIGTLDRMENDIVPKLGINYFGIDMKGFKKNIKYNINSLKLFFKSLGLVKNKLKEFKPDLVIGCGGYVTSPVIYEASKLGIKTIIHEQNSIPGKSNRFLARFSDKIMVSLEDSIKYFPKDKTVYTGNPRSSEASICKAVDRKELFSNNKKIVLIVMGSLGSKSINNVLFKTIPNFKNKDYNIIVVTGDKHYDDFKDLKISNNVKIVPFLSNMINVMKSIDLMVTRAGASTISEILSINIPSIIVPSPYVANNHQYYNAMSLVNNEAASILLEDNFNENSLIDKIDIMINNDELLDKIRNNCKKMSKNDSLDCIIDVIKGLMRG